MCGRDLLEGSTNILLTLKTTFNACYYIICNCFLLQLMTLKKSKRYFVDGYLEANGSTREFGIPLLRQRYGNVA